MFSPITERSLKIRLLFITIYTLLIAGGLTMVLPFMIMISGSMEPRSQVRDTIFPSYLFSDRQLWSRYLESKYQARTDLLRMAWGRNVIFETAAVEEANPQAEIELWKQFLSETNPPPTLYTLGFLRGSRMASYTGREFRKWLLNLHGNNLTSLNEALGITYGKITAIQPPSIDIAGPAVANSPLVKRFYEFLALQPQSLRIVWDVGGYYRAVLLPRLYGSDIAAYNGKYGTQYASYAEVSFSATAPATGGEDWFLFVSKVLRPDFVALTESGLVAMSQAGVGRDEFIRTLAVPEHLRVVSLDVMFSDWAASKGYQETRIPRPFLDRLDFEREKNAWRGRFLILNYQLVLDEILIHGRAIWNTLILVILTIAGTLLVNPLAAYALSRFKLKQTYFLLVFFLATIAFPAEVTMIPVFLQLKEFNLLNTFGALVLPGLANGFSIFLLKGFFDSLPRELYEAAELDGASEWTMFWQISMTLSKPILAVIALGAFGTAYGAFFYALILAPDPKMWTIMVYIYQLRMVVDPPVVYASLIITALPTLAVFVFCQNLILRGIVVPSEK